MKKTVKNTATLALILSIAVLGGCNSENQPVAPGALGTGSGTAAEGNGTEAGSSSSDPAQDDYTKKEIETPDSFKGNTADVTLEKGDTYAVIKIKDYGEIKCKLFPEAAPKGVQNFIDTANSGFYTDKVIHRVVKDFMMQGGSKNGDGMSSPDEPSFGVEYNKNMRHFYGALCYANAGGVNGTQFYIVNSKTCDLSSAGTVEDYDEALATLDQNIEELTDLIGSTTGDEQAYYRQYLDYYQSLKPEYTFSRKVLEQRTAEMEDKYNKEGGTPFLDGGYTVFGQVVEGFDIIDKISEVDVEAQPGGDEISHPTVDIVIESVTIGTVE